MKRANKAIPLLIICVAIISISVAYIIFLKKVNYYKPLHISLYGINQNNDDSLIDVSGLTPFNRQIKFAQNNFNKNSWFSSWGFLKELQISIPLSCYSDSFGLNIKIGDKSFIFNNNNLPDAWNIYKTENTYIFTTSQRFIKHKIIAKTLSVLRWHITPYVILFLSAVFILFFLYLFRFKLKVSFIKLNEKKYLSIGIYIIFLILIIEIFLRIFGFKPHHVYSAYTHFLKQHTNPSLYCTDAVLGNVLKEGTFVTTIDDTIFYTATMGRDSTRITRNLNEDTLYKDKPLIAFMGCSVTFGVGLDDSLTFPWLIQEKLQDYNIKNYGVPGFGTLQMLLYVQKLIIENKKPDKVFVMYFSGHNQRNSMSRNWQRVCFDATMLSIPQSEQMEQKEIFFPYARIKKEHIELKKMHLLKNKKINKHFYKSLPLSKVSAFANLLETFLNAINEKCINSKDVSKKIFALFKLICCKHEIELTLVGFNNDKNTVDMLAYCAQTGIDTLLMDIDLNDKNYNLLPLDRHPNAKANKYFSDKILNYLNERD